MEFSYDPVADALAIHFSYEAVAESDELNPGIIIDYNQKKTVIGIEILNFSQRKLDLNQIIKLSSDEIIPVVSACQ
jgi:uncharacterized protein YuzE